MLNVTAVCQLAFTAAPPLFMALLLTTRPRQGLALRLPPAWSWPAAALLAVLCVPPLAWLTLLILDQFPGLKLLLEEHHPLTGALQSNGGLSVNYLLVLAVLPALCEELAFRGFILTGLAPAIPSLDGGVSQQLPLRPVSDERLPVRAAFRPRRVLALIALRTGSVAPAMVFHLVYNLCFIAPLVFPQVFARFEYKRERNRDTALPSGYHRWRLRSSRRRAAGGDAPIGKAPGGRRCRKRVRARGSVRVAVKKLETAPITIRKRTGRSLSNRGSASGTVSGYFCDAPVLNTTTSSSG